MSKSKATPGRGRPAKFKSDERWNRTTVVLRDWEVAFLDRLAADIREQSGLALNRSDLIRECINVLFIAHEDNLLQLKMMKEGKHLPSAQIGALILEAASKKKK